MVDDLNKREIPMLQFKQWLNEWDDYEYSREAPRRKPNPHAYVFSMKAAELRAYSDVYKRERSTSSAEGIQRYRDGNRTKRIKRYVKYGYPYGDLREDQHTDEKGPLRKPGWIPTAIVVNILKPNDIRRKKTISSSAVASVEPTECGHKLVLPDLQNFGAADLRPLEVIDGQHRLWAFDLNDNDEPLPDDFELPVVAFNGLDIAWQAYLFWSINVSPKRINPSHAFDLYPLLRTQDWLKHNDDLSVYREARAQEITEWMYTIEKSAWHDRINMLGEKGGGRVSQAAWARSLITSFLGTGRGKGRYGLYHSAIYDDSDEPLGWNRAQQISFILEFWNLLQSSLDNVEGIEWLEAYKEANKSPFDDQSSMLNQDMGVRAVHAVLNDLFYSEVVDWGLDQWVFKPIDETETVYTDIADATKALRKQPFHKNLTDFATATAKFDWRSLNGPLVREDRELELLKRAYRGSGGYTLLTRDLVEFLANDSAEDIAEASAILLENAS